MLWFPNEARYRSFSLSLNKKINQKLSSAKSYEIALCVSPNFRYSSKCFAEIYRAQYENAILVYLRGTPIWRPENSVNIWNLLWLSRRLIISTENISIYINSFPNALTSERAQNHEVSLYFSTNSIVACVTHLHNPEIQNALASKRSKLLSCRIVNR